METSLAIYTDGGCSGNPGHGGWAYIIVVQTFQGWQIIAQNKGAQKDTTNNRMELTAVIEALHALKLMDNASGVNIPAGSTIAGIPNQVTVFTDSQYVQKGISEWILTWKRNSWRTSDKKPVKNKELWLSLDALTCEFSINWEWIRGHDGNEYNEMCDRMTQEAIASIRC